MSERPLSGFRVVDLADEKGELCGRMLADLGADVVRVEPPGGARSRRLPPFHGGESLVLRVPQPGKRGVALDLARPTARERLHELLAGADVLIESFAPGRARAARARLRATLLAATRSSSSPRSATSAQTGRTATGSPPTPCSRRSAAWCSRPASRPQPPLIPPARARPATSPASSAAYATLARAAWQRRYSGRGQHIDSRRCSALAQTTDWSFSNAGDLAQRRTRPIARCARARAPSTRSTRARAATCAWSCCRRASGARCGSGSASPRPSPIRTGRRSSRGSRTPTC